MRDLIKILIALAFLSGSFWVGKYEADEKCSTLVIELKAKSEIDKNIILQLQDSLGILKAEFEKVKAKNNIDKVIQKQGAKQKKK